MRMMKLDSVSYTVPIYERKPLGHKPANRFDSDPTGHDGLQPPTDSGPTVWGDVPQRNIDGTPVLRPTTAQLDLNPRSPWKWGACAGAIGAAIGGGLAFALTADWRLALLAGAGLGALAGGLAALAVHGDKVRVVWQTKDVIDPKMTGFNEYLDIGQKDGINGYWHREVPVVEQHIIGQYKIPHAEHYSKEAK